VAYTVDSAKVAAEVAKFSDRARKAWDARLADIVINPYARFGLYVDRLIPILGFPMTTYVYEIVRETSISEEEIFVFTGDFFPEYSPVYVIDESEKRVLVIHLRDNRRA
jgi:hypothetical protein